jgi:hypothetical protein
VTVASRAGGRKASKHGDVAVFGLQTHFFLEHTVVGQHCHV